MTVDGNGVVYYVDQITDRIYRQTQTGWSTFGTAPDTEAQGLAVSGQEIVVVGITRDEIVTQTSTGIVTRVTALPTGFHARAIAYDPASRIYWVAAGRPQDDGQVEDISTYNARTGTWTTGAIALWTDQPGAAGIRGLGFDGFAPPVELAANVSTPAPTASGTILAVPPVNLTANVETPAPESDGDLTQRALVGIDDFRRLHPELEVHLGRGL